MEPLRLAETRTRYVFTYLAALHAALVIGALVVTVFVGVPGALVLGAPSMVILVSAWFEPPLLRPRVRASVDRPRAIEGDTVSIRISLRSKADTAVATIEMIPDKKLDHVGSLNAMVSLESGRDSEADFAVVVEDWGVIPLGLVAVTVRDRFGLSAITTQYRIMSTLRVHIHEEPVRSLTEPDRFRRLVGSHTSQERGDGCEIADIRPYQPGDRLQALNWRISARNDEPWITLRHPDRSTTIVLLLDAYQRFGQQRSDGLRRSIRATLGLARLHLSAQDPVGMLVVGQGVRWFTPELGRLHLHRLTDALLELTTNNWSEGRESQALVHKMVPKDAIVLAVSPLHDKRFFDVVKSLRGRGQSVHVIEPVTHWPNHLRARRGRHEFVPEQAWKLYSLQRQAERLRISNAGVPVIPWEEDQPIESVMLGLRMSQRARRAGALR